MRWGRATAAACAALLGLGWAPAAAADLPLPAPAVGIDVVPGAPVKAERLRTSHVPGPVVDRERVRVELSPTGAPFAVRMLQRIELTGTGDFVIRQRGPASGARAIGGTTAPVIQRGAVVWQGFVPGRKTLEAEIDLDPALESPRLPLGVSLDWRPSAGTSTVQPGGGLPDGGTLVITLTNQTGIPQTLPTGSVTAAELEAPLDALLGYALDPAGTAPVAGGGLPESLPAQGAIGGRAVTVVAPLRITGSVRISGAAGPVAVTGAGTTPEPDGATVAGVLHDATAITVQVPAGGGRLALELAARPTLDPRLLRPPSGRTWVAWAGTRPQPSAVRRAVDILMDGAAAAARGYEYAPYLGLAVPAEVTASFEYVVAPPPPAAAAPRELRPRPGVITLAVVALLGIMGNSVAIWRRL
jgi:hypothetical protein